MSFSDPRQFLTDLFHVAVEASVPKNVLSAHLPVQPKGRTIIVGAGKASAQMAAALEQICLNNRDWHSPLSGLVVTQYGAAETCQNIEIVEAAHPVPDAAGEQAARNMLELVETAGENDLVIALISGGGSSLLSLPVEGLTLADKQQINRSLLSSGAPISAMNMIRKMFSKVKGGRLGAAAYPARLVSLIISDVPGDDPALVASGPSVASIGGAKEAAALVKAFNIALPPAAEQVLSLDRNRPPVPGDACFEFEEHCVIASAKLSLDAAADAARLAGCDVIVLSDAIEGEAREVGQEHGALVREKLLMRSGHRPLLILSGGETSVSIEGGFENAGKGGRNSEYLLALALSIQGLCGVFCLGADTDGRDGSEDNAGAFCDGTSIERMALAGINAQEKLDRHDAWNAFNSVGDLLISGPTGTNVNDFRALLIS